MSVTKTMGTALITGASAGIGATYAVGSTQHAA